ncbi:phosphodiester glycosidase family protein [Roseateles sp. SL47]|uniref:phosphodiester glycosidase family protein n=1 Tax=Roseateles sp. SL47 TaxID=2995138 RepID=UPI002271F9F0|nr:phosphodiester glycosidase family protein [Roseateles sp. SL47]WAC73906.1 phosphodiester glycosidase family protein [Roseateles sp. SL47]
MAPCHTPPPVDVPTARWSQRVCHTRALRQFRGWLQRQHGVVAGVFVSVALLAGCASPSAPPAVSPPSPLAWIPVEGAAGLLYARDTGSPGQVLHWLRLDLQDPTLSLSLTGPEQKGRTLDRFNGATQALAALNASFFTKRFEPRGWTVSSGQAWAPVIAAADSPMLSCDRSDQCQLALTRPVSAPQDSWLAVSGTPWLVRDGIARQPTDDAGCGFCAARHPRTALGLDSSGHLLTLVLVEGRRVEAEGLTLSDLAQRMRAQGVLQALNLDGGGSTALLLTGRLVTSRPFNEPMLRPLANALLIHRVETVRMPTEAPTGSGSGTPSAPTLSAALAHEIMPTSPATSERQMATLPKPTPAGAPALQRPSPSTPRP